MLCNQSVGWFTLRRKGFFTDCWLALPQLLLRRLLLINVIRSPLFISFDLIQMMKNPTINEACIRSTFSSLIRAKAAIKHYADKNSLFSTIYLSVANTSIHSVGNYTHTPYVVCLEITRNRTPIRLVPGNKTNDNTQLVHIFQFLCYTLYAIAIALCHSINWLWITTYCADCSCIEFPFGLRYCRY